MHILIATIGTFKKSPEQALYLHYIERLPWKVTLKEIDIKKNLETHVRKAQEAELLLKAVADADLVIALDEKGKAHSSEEFAGLLRTHRDKGARTIAFVIGGADGLHESVHKRAATMLCFGRLTWPHLLVRGLLAEQLYRAYTIMNNHPYHRG